MGLYRWNCGGQYRGKLWEQDLLADSQVCKSNYALFSKYCFGADYLTVNMPGSLSLSRFKQLQSHSG